jgi:hypothetical protein
MGFSSVNGLMIKGGYSRMTNVRIKDGRNRRDVVGKLWDLSCVTVFLRCSIDRRQSLVFPSGLAFTLRKVYEVEEAKFLHPFYIALPLFL